MRHFTAVAALVVANLWAANHLVDVYRETIAARGKDRCNYPAEVADALWQRGLTGLFVDRPIRPACLKPVDGAYDPPIRPVSLLFQPSSRVR